MVSLKARVAKKLCFISYSLQVYQTVYIHVQVVRVDQIASNHWRTGKILLGELNIICPNETCWSQMHKMILS